LAAAIAGVISRAGLVTCFLAIGLRAFEGVGLRGRRLAFGFCHDNTPLEFSEKKRNATRRQPRRLKS
jgi:hypothetical protein